MIETPAGRESSGTGDAQPDQVVHLEVLYGAEVMVWRSGRATVTTWDDATHRESPAAREMAASVGVSA